MDDAKQSVDVVPGAAVDGAGAGFKARGRRVSGALRRRIEAAIRQPIIGEASRGARYRRFLSGQIVRLNPSQSRRGRRVELRREWLEYVASRHGVGPVMRRKAWGRSE